MTTADSRGSTAAVGRESASRGRCRHCLPGELPQIDAVEVFLYQVQIAQQDASERGRVIVSYQLLPHLGKQLRDA